MSVGLESAAWTGRIGGPVGSRASRAGSPWFDPARFAIPLAGLTMALCLLRQVPCRPLPGDFPNPYKRLCYSDIQSHYFVNNYATGAGVFDGNVLNYSPLTSYLVQFAKWVAGLFSPQDSATNFEQQIVGSTAFVVTCGVLLSVAFLAVVAANLRIGVPSASAASDGVHIRAWDAILIAICPVVLMSGLISWELLAVGLTSLAIAAWAKRKQLAAGVLFGLACAARLYPLAVLLGIGLLCLRAGKVKPWLQTALIALGSFALVNLPVAIINFSGWRGYWLANLTKQSPDLGSVWHLLELVGIKVPVLSLLSFGLMLLAWGGTVLLLLRAPRRPRVGQVAFLLVLIFLLLNKGYAPQFALWLLPLLVLARPKVIDVATWCVAELFYYCAVWGFLDGVIGPNTAGQGVYWLAIVTRICVQLWLIMRVVDDIYRPWDDPVRAAFIDDPAGGVLNHAVDVPWAAQMASAADSK